MHKNLRRKWIFICVVMLVCVVGIIGLPKSKQQLVDNWNRNIRLGLDLKGGSHIVLQIQVQDAFKAEADLLIDRIKELLQKENVQVGAIDRNEPDSIETADGVTVSIRGVRPDQTDNVRRIVNDLAGQEWTLSSDGSGFTLTLRRDAAIRLRQETLAQSISTIQKKVDALGIAEVSVQQRGGSGNTAEILVQLPGVDDPARVKGILQTAAILELHGVIDGPFASQAEALSNRGGTLPASAKFVRGSARAGGTGQQEWWIVARSPVITGRDLRDARAQRGETGQWETNFSLRSDAAERFGRFTEANVDKRLAIVLDNIVLSAPTIQSRISDQGRITGAGNQQESQDLALNLRAGSLPASLKVIEERTVGPSLGVDSIHKGVVAGILGLMLVVASMLLYYRGAGLNAVTALVLNTIMTIAVLSYLDATWTLPGIAGLILSIGMAVDSNVLIFERIKEEQRSGKTVAAAIPSGFQRAFTTIVDTHVTTVVASTFLFLFGTGPVRGFAVTLVIGLVANLFTAVFVSRAIFDLQLRRNPGMQHLSIGKEFFKPSKIDFLSKRWLTLGASVLAIVISLTALILNGGPRYGLDFRGGTLMYVKFNPKPSINELRSALSAKLPGDFSLQESQGTGEFIIGTGLADEQSLEQARLTVEQTLRKKYANLGGKIDLNNANAASLEERLRAALPAAGVSLDDQNLKGLVSRILNYRDREKGGLIGSVDELTSVPGIDAKVVSVLKEQAGTGSFNVRSVEVVGPRAGEQLRRQGLYATLGALGGMLIYVAFRFRFISGAAAVIATIHDVIITLGLFMLTGREIDLTIVAALLTLIGYSMNDKIVVFDRVRENEQGLGRKSRPTGSFLDLVNQSINQTLSRTLLTAGPTLLACLALYFFGGDVLNGIAFALFAGIVIGTYSSIFVASALLVMWRRERQPALTPRKA